MEKEQREWVLFGVMVLLLVAVVLMAWLDVPELAPAAVTHNTTQTVSTSTTVSTAFSVSLNSATVEDLMKLDGVGEKTAQKIIAYREAHGGFSGVDELLEVEGIGEKKLEKWKPYLTV
ncbi:MAG: helix-hairpin-helix domain-containing protein [Clostridia bacterium]|nr:helix-hairpin-helix domain-containing protein [Clostridia bacterium]